MFWFIKDQDTIVNKLLYIDLTDLMIFDKD